MRNKTTSSKSTPNLRFPEFSGEWEEKSLAELVANYGGTSLEEYTDQKSEYKFVSIGNYTADGKYADDGRRIPLNQKTKNKMLNENDLVMVLNDKTTTGRLIGSTLLVDENDTYIYNQRSERLVANRDIDAKFLWFLLNSEKIRRAIFKLSQGGTQIYVNYSSVSKLKLTLPRQTEQEKIATFLSTVDERIGMMHERLGLLKKYKKGVMQKIFSQEIRFKDENGKEYPKWGREKLGDIARIKPGNLNVQDANIDGKYVFFDRSENIKRYDDYTFDNEALIYAGEGSQFLPRYFKGKYGLHQRSYAISDTHGIDMKFLFYYMSTQNNHFLKYAVGTTAMSLRMDCFNKCVVLIPLEEEQRKIAAFLSAIDDKIALEERRLQQAKGFKKSLLQQMFV